MTPTKDFLLSLLEITGTSLEIDWKPGFNIMQGCVNYRKTIQRINDMIVKEVSNQCHLKNSELPPARTLESPHFSNISPALSVPPVMLSVPMLMDIPSASPVETEEELWKESLRNSLQSLLINP